MDAKLKAMKVPELKALLTAASLSTVGNKDALISRVKEASLLTEDQDSAKEAAPAETAASAVSNEKVKNAPTTKTPTIEVLDENAKPVVPEVAAEGKTARPALFTDEEKAELVKQEEAKRAARANRFGIPVVPVVIPEEKKVAPAKLSKNKAEGLKVSTKVVQSAEEIAEVTKKLAERAQRFGTSVVEKVSDAVTGGKKDSDPLSSADQEEEERRRKRAARFGGGPDEKKTKIDSESSATVPTVV